MATSRQAVGRVSSRWSQRLLLPAIFLVGLLALAPTIICRTPLAQTLVSYSFASLEGEIRFERLSFGWLRPLELRGMNWVDSQGEFIASVERISGDRNLWQLLADRSNLGRIHLSRPLVSVAWSETGSNWETILAPLLQTEEGAAPLAASIEIEQGRATLSDRVTGKTAALFDFNLSLEVPPAGGPITGKLSTQIDGPAAGASENTYSPTTLGQLEGRFSWQSNAADAWGNGELAFNARQLPLAVAAPLLRRAAAGAAIEGQLTCEASGSWSDGTGQFELRQCEAQEVRLAAPTWVGKDRLYFERLAAGGVCRLTPEAINLSNLFLTSYDAALQASLLLPRELLPRDTAEMTTASAADAWLRTAEQVTGRIELDGEIAELARQLPQLLRLRAGAEVTAGKIHAALVSEQREGTHLWRAEASATDLAAVRNGQALRWEKPLSLLVVARREGETIAIEQLSATADFLELEGSGRWNNGAVSLRGDLDKLVRQIGQFVRTDDLRLRGTTQGAFRWQVDAANQFSALGDLSVLNFEYAAADRRPWREPDIKVHLAAYGEANAAGLKTLDSANLELRSGGEVVLLALTAPVVGSPNITLGKDTVWPLALEMQGEINRWLPRIESFVLLPDWTADGGFSIAAQATLSTAKANIASLAVETRQLRIWGPGVFIDEPNVKLEGGGQCDWLAGEARSPEWVLTTKTVAARGEKNVLNWNAATPRAATHIAFRADLARAFRWTQDPRKPASQLVGGEATGALSVQYQEGANRLQWDCEVVELVYTVREETGGAKTVSNGGAWKRIWREPRLQLQGEAAYASQQSELHILNAVVATPAVQLQCQGRLTSLDTTPIAEATGTIAYDLAQLVPRLRPLIDENLVLKGRETSTFHIKGPLTTTAAANQTTAPLLSLELEAGGGLKWEFVRVLGVDVGPGALEVQLRNGIAEASPLELPMAAGMLRLAPTVDLQRSPGFVRLAPGQIAENLSIEPAMCRNWLKYVAPMLADVTQAQGVFSLQLERAEFPLDEPANGVVIGTITIESARVGPGPLAEQYLGLAQQLQRLSEGRPLGQAVASGQREWIDLPKQEIPLRISEGRVYHQGVKMQIGDVVITTRGSVGFDQSVQLVAEIPVQDRWLKTEIARQALKGQVVRIPVGGNVMAPRIDQRAINDLAAQAVGNAANRLLQGQINRGLERLFGAPK